MYIVMLGAPGSGKGTIGKILSQDMNLKHLSTGDIFRDQMSRQTELGKKAEEYIKQGLLVPDDVTMGMIKDRLSQKDVEEGAILDGFARTVVQAKALSEFLTETRPNQKQVTIELNVPDEVIIERLSGRLTCSNKECGAIYNLKTRPPKEEGICDICGSKLSKRDDDNEETVRKRLVVYHQNSQELLDFYENHNMLYSICPTDLDEAVSNIKQYLKGSN